LTVNEGGWFDARLFGFPQKVPAGREVSSMSLRSIARLGSLAAVFLFALARPSVGQAQIKPRIIIGFDTSGSMGQGLDGSFTFGDGAGDSDCERGLDIDCDGSPNDSRMFIAKDAVRNAVLAYGDVDWALARFAQLQGTDISCQVANDWECSAAPGGPFVSSFGNPQCYTGAAFSAGNCAGGTASIATIPDACEPGVGLNDDARLRQGGDPLYCINYSGDCADDINDFGAGQILVGFSGLSAFVNARNEPAILKWLDNTESNPLLAGTTSGNFCSHATTGNCELRATGCTPLAGILSEMGTYLTTVKSTDTKGDCRPYSVLLITDGNQYGFAGDPVATATSLAAQGIATYVVGVSVTGGEKTQLNSIAQAGGTDAGSAGGDRAYFASDPDTLAAGLADIVRKSLLIETCDGDDNDCDTNIDEGFSLYCDAANAHPAADLCTDPGEQDCDGVDDNCNGSVDEGLLNRCGTCGPEPLEICDSVDNDCDGLVNEGNVCNCFATSEICDGIDNDCDLDNAVDEGVTRPCGTDVGDCTAGIEVCTAGVWGACNGTNPGTETCNGEDDNCDGVVDQITRPCGVTEGVCQAGTQLCTNNVWGACVGEVSGDTEVCDGFDNNCDGDVDEGNPGGGANCGMTGCAVGTFQCMGGSLVCVGMSSGGAELCNGEDDDCDGTIDEGLGVGGPCGPSTGDCVPGMVVCIDDAPQCVGGIGDMDEICDGIDNDCDVTIDEDIQGGGACGSTEGLCRAGNLACSEGDEVCQGEVPPVRETCDCDDNDCDGEIDEDPGAGTLCPAGSECKNCQCSLPCLDSEFGFSCPEGKAPQDFGGDCFCVAAACDDTECAGETVEVSDDVKCKPGDPDLANCVCKNNFCTYSCEGVVCGAGLVCNPRDPTGRCEENSCRGLGCPVSEICNAATGDCEADPCVGVECGEQVCRLGECEPSCAGVTCRAGEKCASGACVDDKCADVDCDAGEACDPESGACVANVCEILRCPVESVCSISEGRCVPDPCTYVHCPGTQVCSRGECGEPVIVVPDATTDGDAGVPNRAPGKRVLATGSGFTCSAHAPGGPGSAPPAPWFALLALGLVLRRLRRRGAVATGLAGLPLVVAVIGAAVLGAGCNVKPFCLDCANSGLIDGQVPGYEGGTMSIEGGVGPGEGGVKPDGGDAGLETCNAADDDGDGKVDEDFDFDTSLDHCGGCNQKCAPAHSFPSCDEQDCEISQCDVGWHNINGALGDGCEYRCLPTATDDDLCDLTDNDCDNKIDEDVDFDGDLNNCGECGVSCSFANASAICDEGDCALVECDTNYFDVDGKISTGCEYPCTATGAEQCDLQDDDCDGTIDEGNPGGGATCGETDGLCTAGTLTCLGGDLVCSGGVGPSFETCDDEDNDCDDDVDEDTQFNTDINNCGECGTQCDLDFAIPACVGGDCEVVACESGHFDRDGDPLNGCEYACNYRGPEICNGIDDDCDKLTDEVGELTPPANFCNANGVCAGTTATCGNALGWVCNFSSGFYENVEVSCDGRDNDCDGASDEGYAVGDECSNGEEGECLRVGAFECNMDGDGVVCDAPAVGGGTAETCDGADEDCDGAIDEDMDTTTVPAVAVSTPGGTVYVMKYEASRPDATAGNAGVISDRACSRANVQPWTNVTWEEANDACCALNPSGTCAGSDGWQLCDAGDWQEACESTTNTCDWSYSAACTTSSSVKCNGAEYDCDAGTAGDQDCLVTTGNATFPACYSNWGAAGTVYDLSGNVKEWTSTERGSSTVHEIRGGAYNNLEDGRSCTFDFTAGDSNYLFPNTGFRCCYYP
jgi:MYXO-CTERM domain-containing protein